MAFNKVMMYTTLHIVRAQLNRETNYILSDIQKATIFNNNTLSLI